MVRYLLTEKTVEERKCFGITAVAEDGKTEVIDDIFSDFAEIVALADCLQANSVPMEHFRDVVDDYLAD